MDLLLHFPRRHEDWLNAVPVSNLKSGAVALVEGELVDVRTTPARGGKQHLLAVLEDAEGGEVTLRFFHVTPGLRSSMHAGRRLRARGTARFLRSGWEMAHPKLQSQNAEAQVAAVYPAVKPLNSAQLRRLVARALQTADLTPTASPCAEFDGGDWTAKDALTAAHAPSAEDDASPPPDDHPAWRRLRYEELLAHQIVLRRRYHRRGEDAPALAPPPGWDAAFRAGLPFSLTAAQRRTVAEILADIARPRPMRRLLQGDVGSGKTVVAAVACLCAAKSGQTAAFMAPTEILAEQHFQTLSTLLEPARVNCELLTGAIRGRQRKDALNRLEFGIAAVAVGTHTLFQENISLPRLAVAVIDEQHRFGVEQRRAFTRKGGGAHQLMMSATPIPRTLAMSMFADMDVSVLDEKPGGRQPVRTLLIDAARRGEVLARIARHVVAGGRAYWVCPRVEESEDAELSDVQTLAAEAQAAHPQMGVGILHGRMKPAEKKTVMDDFRAGQFGLLVATTVIEVGVDVPQADVMVIERGDRMGLSQLHQLRGRVGRGRRRGVCLLMYRPPLSAEAHTRLSVIKKTTDGFEVARQDLALRGPGELLGSRQSGLPELRVARFAEEPEIINAARKTAEHMLQNDKRGCVRHVRRWFGGAPGRRSVFSELPKAGVQDDEK